VPPEPLTREMPVARIAQSRMKSDAPESQAPDQESVARRSG
jgi:hypothetical protein